MAARNGALSPPNSAADRNPGCAPGNGVSGLGDIDGYSGHCPILGHTIARGTVANILKQHGIEPAPERNRNRPLERASIEDIVRIRLQITCQLLLQKKLTSIRAAADSPSDRGFSPDLCPRYRSFYSSVTGIDYFFS